MQELIGRLAPLDPDATETLRVVTYFDALMSAGLGLDALVRAAASLAGTTVGVRTQRKHARFTPTGERDQSLPRPAVRAAVDEVDAEVWIERPDSAHANDAIVLERLVFAVSFALKRDSPSRIALDIALDGALASSERLTALERLGFTPDDPVRAVVRAATGAERPQRTTIALGASGVVQVSVVREVKEESLPCGVGVLMPADELPYSYRTAELAYRLRTDSLPMVCADDFGSLLVAADELLRRSPRHPDIESLRALDTRSRTELDGLATSPSVRAAAAGLHVHHSTLQARHRALTRRLGYDPLSPVGAARYALAELATRLSHHPT